MDSFIINNKKRYNIKNRLYLMEVLKRYKRFTSYKKDLFLFYFINNIMLFIYFIFIFLLFLWVLHLTTKKNRLYWL